MHTIEIVDAEGGSPQQVTEKAFKIIYEPLGYSRRQVTVENNPISHVWVNEGAAATDGIQSESGVEQRGVSVTDNQAEVSGRSDGNGGANRRGRKAKDS